MKLFTLLLTVLISVSVAACQSSTTSPEKEAMAKSLGITVEQLDTMTDEEIQRLMIEAASVEGES